MIVQNMIKSTVLLVVLGKDYAMLTPKRTIAYGHTTSLKMRGKASITAILLKQ